VIATLLAARYAFRVRVQWPRAPRPAHPVLFYNPLSGGGKAEQLALAQEARSRGIEPIELRRRDDLEQLVRDAVARGADALGMAGGDGSQAIVAMGAAEHDLPYCAYRQGRVTISRWIWNRRFSSASAPARCGCGSPPRTLAPLPQHSCPISPGRCSRSSRGSSSGALRAMTTAGVKPEIGQRRAGGAPRPRKPAIAWWCASSASRRIRRALSGSSRSCWSHTRRATPANACLGPTCQRLRRDRCAREPDRHSGQLRELTSPELTRQRAAAGAPWQGLRPS
jgi:hypothetical protein